MAQEHLYDVRRPGDERGPRMSKQCAVRAKEGFTSAKTSTESADQVPGGDTGFGRAGSHRRHGGAPSAASVKGPTATLTWGITSLDSSLDPGLVYNIDPNVVTAAMCNSLLQFGPQGQLEPELASSWKQTSPTTFVYNIVHNAKFWDGNPVTAADVAFSVDRIASPKLASPLLSLMQTGSIEKAAATGKWQVTIYLSKANPIAADLPATPIGQVVEESSAKKWGLAFGTHPAR